MLWGWFQYSEEEIRAAVDVGTMADSYVAAHCHPAEAVRRAALLGCAAIRSLGYSIQSSAAAAWTVTDSKSRSSDRSASGSRSLSFHSAEGEQGDIQNLNRHVLRSTSKAFQIGDRLDRHLESSDAE
jgi:hypothetical protein